MSTRESRRPDASIRTIAFRAGVSERLLETYENKDPASARAKYCSRHTWLLGSPGIVTADGAVGGMRTGYAARFEQDQLTRIVEIRGDGSDEVNGDYVFRGARLLQYNGAILNRTGTIALSFDIDGALQQHLAQPPPPRNWRQSVIVRNCCAAWRSPVAPLSAINPKAISKTWICSGCSISGASAATDLASAICPQLRMSINGDNVHVARLLVRNLAVLCGVPARVCDRPDPRRELLITAPQ